MGWPEAERQLAQTPDLAAKVLFERLKQRYPDQVDDKQLRTFQRRVRDWRMRYISQQDEQPEPQKQALPQLMNPRIVVRRRFQLC